MKVLKFFVIVFVGLVIFLFFVRLILPIQLDDVSPGIFCEEELLNLADVYYVIPKFENVSLDEDWCREILNRGKEISMHGVYHSFEEFGYARDLEYLNEGIEIFEGCFEFRPESFKPPQIAWTRENDWMKDKIKVYSTWNEIFHKVYHCGDTGIIPNWLIRIY